MNFERWIAERGFGFIDVPDAVLKEVWDAAQAAEREKDHERDWLLDFIHHIESEIEKKEGSRRDRNR